MVLQNFLISVVFPISPTQISSMPLGVDANGMMLGLINLTRSDLHILLSLEIDLFCVDPYLSYLGL